ncbi:MAG TPA: hypothetical protein PKN13_10195 [Accumulibacter sp.]|nr:hypothetical protein [Accumulibacter sp.]HMW17938.1 hypothetical protein [Accumulibacter sp.]HMX21764.1 hypothetical protein [Accumulibacter sp.]HNC18271.1 hypothetical protein [Accumulibacter sp.]HND80514.1 hypothetical protein [Accumulibacter sp.]
MAFLDPLSDEGAQFFDLPLVIGNPGLRIPGQIPGFVDRLFDKGSHCHHYFVDALQAGYDGISRFFGLLDHTAQLIGKHLVIAWNFLYFGKHHRFADPIVRATTSDVGHHAVQPHFRVAVEQVRQNALNGHERQQAYQNEQRIDAVITDPE